MKLSGEAGELTRKQEGALDRVFSPPAESRHPEADLFSEPLSLVAVALRGERQLAVGRRLVGLVLQQPRHVGVGDAVVVAAEADVVLLQLNGPEGGVQLAVLVLPVRVHATDEAQQQQHHQDDDGQDDDVKLRPGDLGQPGGGVVRGAAEAGQQRLGGGGRAGVAGGRDARDASSCGGGGGGSGWWCRCRRRKGLSHGRVCWRWDRLWSWPRAVVSRGVADEARRAELALRPRRVVDAAQAVASFGVTKLDGTLRIGVATAVAVSTANG